MTLEQPLTIIGRTEQVWFPGLKIGPIKAKVDTGANLCSLWATKIKVAADGSLTFVPFGKSFPKYTGQLVVVPKGGYKTVVISNSFGDTESRFAIKLQIKIARKLVLGTFTLANRASKEFPILLGKKLIIGKFLVDVASTSAANRRIYLQSQKISANHKRNNDKIG